MKFNLTFIGLIMVCLTMAACNKYAEEKAMVETVGTSNKSPLQQAIPACEERDKKTHRYLNEKGCTEKEMREWSDAMDAKTSK